MSSVRIGWQRTRRGPRGHRRPDGIDEALASFKAIEDYRARVTSIAQSAKSVRIALLHLELAESGKRLRVISQRARDLQVPPGCEDSHRALLFALRSYEIALRHLTEVPPGPPVDPNPAWGEMKDGDVLLALAVQSAREV